MREWRRGDEREEVTIADFRLQIVRERVGGKREEGGKCECYEDRRRQSPFFVEMFLVEAFLWQSSRCKDREGAVGVSTLIAWPSGYCRGCGG